MARHLRRPFAKIFVECSPEYSGMLDSRHEATSGDICLIVMARHRSTERTRIVVETLYREIRYVVLPASLNSHSHYYISHCSWMYRLLFVAVNVGFVRFYCRSVIIVFEILSCLLTYAYGVLSNSAAHIVDPSKFFLQLGDNTLPDPSFDLADPVEMFKSKSSFSCTYRFIAL